MSKEKAKKRLAVHPDEAQVVQMIYGWYLSNMGAKSIAERLNTEGYLYRSKSWSKNRILDIIGDEAYYLWVAGHYLYDCLIKKRGHGSAFR